MENTIFFGLDRLQRTALSLSERPILFVDSHIQNTHGVFVREKLQAETIVLEAKKTREKKAELEDRLFSMGVKRGSCFIALGGGTTTDLIGFLASTYMRGVPLILIPTTLLAMVDSAIGGKTGIDTPLGKNVIGSFYLPDAVFIEPRFIETLSEKERKNGLSEILKIALVQSSSLWEKALKFPSDLPDLIFQAIDLKRKIVEKDFREKKGLRRILNFGHTIGHALEITSFLSHGEAIAFGCMAETYLSYLEGHLEERICKEILEIYRFFGYHRILFDRNLVMEALKMDKKSRGFSPRFVMIEKIGSFVNFGSEYCKEVPLKRIEETLTWLQDVKSPHYSR